MATSQNGWAVASRTAQDENPIYGTVHVPNGVLAGDVAVVLRYVAARYHHEVEPLVAGTCWGWFVKEIEGSATISNHASGTAIDLNADQHPMGSPTTKHFTAAQIKACRAIVAACGGVVRWGGDYTGRPDGMHWEIVGTRAATHTLATKIKETDVFTDADKKWLTAEIKAQVIAALKQDGVVPAPANSATVKTNPSWAAANTLTDIAGQTRTLNAKADEILAAVRQNDQPEPTS